MTPYPPFSGDDTSCPKCRGDVGSTYQQEGTVLHGFPGSYRLIQDVRGAPEWLLRVCRECDYGWAEACADAGTSREGR